MIRSSAERRLCAKKNSYTPAEARAKLRERRPKEHAPLFAYTCQQCGKCHLTKLRPPYEANLEKPL